MVSKAVKIRLGIFMVIGLTLIVLFVALVAGNRLVQKRDIYFVEFENYSVAGLQVGGAVNYQGIKVGRVDDIKINPKDVTKIILTLSLDHGTPIKEDTEAILVYVGITGVKAVELRGGTNEARLLKTKAYIKVGSSAIDDVADRAMSIAEKVDQIASNLAALTDEENRRNIAEILRQSSLLIEDTRNNLSTTISSIAQLSDNAVKITSDASTKLDEISDNLNRNMNELTNTTTRNLDQISLAATSNLDSIGLTTKNSIQSLTGNLNRDLETLTTSLNTAINDINQQTTALLRDTQYNINAVGSNSNEMILTTTREITQLSVNLNQSVERINQLIGSSEFDRILANVASLSDQLATLETRGLMQELSTTIARAGSLIGNLDRTLIRSRSNLYETLESLREASENLNDFSKQISDQPSILLRGN